MAKRELLAIVCLVSAAIMLTAALGQAASEPKSPLVVRNSATSNPIPDWGKNGTQGLKQWYLSAVTVWIIKNGSVNYSIDGGPRINYTAPIVFAEDGVFQITFRGYINETRNKTVKIEVKKDTVSPATTSSYSPDELRCTLNATDNTSGVEKILYRIDGGKWFNYYGPFRADPGAHVVEYYSTDVAGNSETVKFINFTVEFNSRSTEMMIVIGVFAVGIAAFFVVFLRARKPSAEVAKPEESRDRLE